MYHHFAQRMESLGCFEREPQLAVAVSGGADSMATLLLCQEWTRSNGGKVSCLTVDHGLRKESEKEAQQVAEWCALRGINHHILTWKKGAEKPTQADAREGRYELLTDWCRNHHVPYLLTGHHRGDQAETLFFRLARGSGLDGLACMSAITSYKDIQLVRPLLDVPKSALENYLRAQQQEWIIDPSNETDRYTRNIIRKHLSSEMEMRAASLAERFGVIRLALERSDARAMAECVSVFSGGYALIDKKSFAALPREAAVRLLANLAQGLNGAAYKARTEKLQRLHSMLAAPAFKRTMFSGLLWQSQPKSGTITVSREPAKIAPSLPLQPGIKALWDGRFEVEYQGKGRGIYVRALGTDGLKKLKTTQKSPHIKALPSFWHLEELLAVPHIGYTNLNRHLECTATFRPAKALAGGAFFSMNEWTKKEVIARA